MFDISFFELILCGIVALVVIGPERLPETVRAVSLWIGRLKRSLRETRSELEKQLGADDIRRQLHNEEIMQSLEKTRRDIERAMGDGESGKLIEHQSQPYIEYQELPDHAHMDEPVPSIAEPDTIDRETLNRETINRKTTHPETAEPKSTPTELRVDAQAERDQASALAATASVTDKSSS